MRSSQPSALRLAQEVGHRRIGQVVVVDQRRHNRRTLLHRHTSTQLAVGCHAIGSNRVIRYNKFSLLNQFVSGTASWVIGNLCIQLKWSSLCFTATQADNRKYSPRMPVMSAETTTNTLGINFNLIVLSCFGESRPTLNSVIKYRQHTAAAYFRCMSSLPIQNIISQPRPRKFD